MFSQLTEMFSRLNRYDRDQEFMRYRLENLKPIIKVLSFAMIFFVLGWHLLDVFVSRPNLKELLLLSIIASLISLVLLVISTMTKKKRHLKILIYFGFYFGAFYATMLSNLTGGAISHYWIALNFLLLVWLVMIPFGYRELLLNGLAFIFQYNLILFISNPGSTHFLEHFEIDATLSGTYFICAVIAVYNQDLSLRLFLNEKLVRKTEEQNRLLIESLQEGLFVIQEGKFVFLNQTIVRIVDYAVAELLGKDFLTVIAPEDKQMVLGNHLYRMRGENAPSSYEATLIKKDGTTRVPVIISVSTSTFNGLTALVGTAKDISEIKATQVAIKERERSLNAIFETAIVGIAVGRKDGKLLQCNAHWLELFGYSREEMMQRSYNDITFPEDLPSTQKMMAELIANEIDHYHFEKRYVRKDGTVFWGYVSVNAIRNDNGELNSLVATLFDLTDRKAIEEELLQAQEMLRNESQQLQKENLRSQYETLKSQVNPHFLFNSLNVLTSLIRLEPDLAEKFAEQMAKVYRYVLEHREEDLVSLRSEVDFISSYVFLLEIRFLDKVMVNINIPEIKMGLKVPPLAVQLLIENAVKHNTFSRKQPLRIDIFVDSENYLNVINNFQKREMKIESTGVGLVNIGERIRHLTDKYTFFGEVGEQFVARIPLL